jgi:phosphate-selective porin OprO/OprP
MRKQTLLTAALAVAAGAIGIAAPTTDAAAQATTSWSGAPRTREEDREFKINGRMQYDVFNIQVDDGNPATNDIDYQGSFMRRAFIGVEGRFTQNWRYNVKFDLAPSASSSSDEVRLDDAFLEYAGQDFSLVVGQNNAVSHMEDRTSSNYTPFNERSMIDQAFGFGKIFGLGFITNGGNWSAGVEYYTDTLNNSQTVDTTEPQSLVGRVTWAPYYQRTPDGVSLVHLGLTARHRDGGTGFFSYSARPAQNSLTGLSSTISSAGNWGSDDLYGAELAFQHNAFGATVEYMQVEAHRAGAGADASANGGYVDLFWSPTGENRNYSAGDGGWGRITPRRTLGSDGGIGHVMLSARYEWLDLTDSAFAAGGDRGEQTGWLAGATWAPIGYVKFQLNYGQYELERPGTTNDRDYETMSLRTQFDF